MNGIIGYVVKRREVRVGPSVTYAERNVRDIEPIPGQDAPDPVRDSDFNDRPARMPKVVFTNINGILSVMQDEFGFPLWAPAPHAAYALGPGGFPSGQDPFVDRVNVEDPASIPYGSQVEMPSSSADAYYPLFP
jgi:hypothetical protein